MIYLKLIYSKIGAFKIFSLFFITFIEYLDLLRNSKQVVEKGVSNTIPNSNENMRKLEFPKFSASLSHKVDHMITNEKEEYGDMKRNK